MNAIPTKYKGIQFRSRLEATWACFFDKVGFPWHHEPFDLAGYIPDFVLEFPKRKILVECKPIGQESEAWDHVGKIADSGWRDWALVVGYALFSAPTQWHGVTEYQIGSWADLNEECFQVGLKLGTEKWWQLYTGMIQWVLLCRECRKLGPFDRIYMNPDRGEAADEKCPWCGRSAGCYEWDYLRAKATLESQSLPAIFASAKNEVQWMRPG